MIPSNYHIVSHIRPIFRLQILNGVVAFGCVDTQLNFGVELVQDPDLPDSHQILV